MTPERCCASGNCADRESHIRRRPRRNRGNQFYLDRGPSGAESALCGAEPTCRDMSWGDARFESRRRQVECVACVGLRSAS